MNVSAKCFIWFRPFAPRVEGRTFFVSFLLAIVLLGFRTLVFDLIAPFGVWL